VEVAVHALHGERLVGQLPVALLDTFSVHLDGRHHGGHRVEPLQKCVDGERFARRTERRGQGAVHGRHRRTQPVGLRGEVAARGEVARAGRCHVPALCGVRGELGHHAQRVKLTVERRLERSEQPCHVRVARPGQLAVQLDVGVDARSDAAEHLEHRGVAEHDAGVALLGADDPSGGVHGQLRRRFLDEAQWPDRRGLIHQ
jgi:hypothetical protein